jgi:hypothetical protein
MKKAIIGLGMAVVGAAVFSAQDSRADVAQPRGWMLLSAGAQTSGQGFALKNLDSGQCLNSKGRTGVDLGWQGCDGNTDAAFVKQGGGQIKCGDTVALRIDGRHYYYSKQTFGINITDTRNANDSNIYQWKIVCDGTGPVPLNTPVGLFNTKENDYLVGGMRLVGVNLIWNKDGRTVPQQSPKHGGRNIRSADWKRFL